MEIPVILREPMIGVTIGDDLLEREIGVRSRMARCGGDSDCKDFLEIIGEIGETPGPATRSFAATLKSNGELIT